MNIKNSDNPVEIFVKESVIPSLKVFVENGIIETQMPSFASKRVEFECVILSSLIIMLMVRRVDSNWIEENGILYEFVDSIKEFYEQTNLNAQNNFSEKELNNFVFERLGNYEQCLQELDLEGDMNSLYDLVYSVIDENPWFVGNQDLNRLNFKKSIIQTMTINAQLLDNADFY